MVHVLFLDVESALRPWSYVRSRGSAISKTEVDPKCKNRLNCLLEEVPNLKIVLISEFRIGKSLREIKDLFSEHYRISEHIIDSTPVLKNNNHFEEVRYWIRASKLKIKKIAIIHHDPTGSEPEEDDFFEIDSEQGFSEHLYKSVLNHYI